MAESWSDAKTPPDQPTANSTGMYHVWSCRTPAGATAPVDGWTPAPASTCSSGGKFWLAVGKNSGSAASERRMTWQPAPGLRGVSMELWRHAIAASARGISVQPPGQGYVRIEEWPSVVNPDGFYQVAIEEYESILSRSLPGATIGSDTAARVAENRLLIDPLAPENQAQVPPVQIVAGCANWELQYDCQAQYSIFAADTRMLDPTAPTTSSPGGALAAALGSERPAQSGAVGFTLQTSDVGSGVLKAVLEVDGRVVTTTSAAPGSATCAPTAASDGLRGYVLQVPCPLTASIGGSWDTTAVGNGIHDVRLVVEDAAGHTAVAATGKVLVNNVAKSPVPGPTTPAPPIAGTTPAIGPGTPDEVRGEPNGSAGPGAAPTGDTAQVTLTWPATARAASTKPSIVRRCRAAGYAKRYPWRCVGRPAATSLQRAWSATTTDKLRVRLETPGGAPIAGARVQLRSQQTSVGAASKPLDPVITGADGTAEVLITRGDGSRRFTASWFPRVSDTVAGAEGSATLAVGASTSFVAPRRVGPSARVKFSGTLRGPAGSLGAVPITLQVFNQGRWKTFEAATTDASGRWGVGIQFAPRRGTYPVRVKVGQSPTFPFVPGVAAQSRVRVS